MKFPVRILIKEYVPIFHRGEEFFWKSLCIVYDNEALGFLERLISATSIDHKVEPVEPERKEPT